MQRIFQRKTLASWGLGIEVWRRRERGGASLLSHLGGGGGGGSGGGDDSPPASARDTRPGPAAATARVHESVLLLLLLLRPPLRLRLLPLSSLPPLPCGLASRRDRPPLPLQPLPDGRRLQPRPIDFPFPLISAGRLPSDVFSALRSQPEGYFLGDSCLGPLFHAKSGPDLSISSEF